MKTVWRQEIIRGGRRFCLPICQRRRRAEASQPGRQGRLPPLDPGLTNSNLLCRSLRRTGVGLIVCGLLGMVTQGATLFAATASRPNIILILADDLGLPALGCTGGIYATPHLDSLAKEGMRFEHGYSMPLCGPTRATLLTGRYLFRTGMLNNRMGDSVTPEKDGCVALRMKEAGYATAVVGKWRQLSSFATKADGAKWGFDEFMIWGAGQPEEDDDDAATKADRKAKKNATAAKEMPTRGDRYWKPDYNVNGKMLEKSEGKYGPDVLNEFAIDFVRRHKDGPFFLYYPTPLIHGPILATPDSKEQGTMKRQAAKKALANAPGAGSLYADNIAYLDKLVGKLVAEIDALKLREKTLIMFVGDNGSVPIGTVNGRTIDGKKGNMTEGGSRVPFLANWRGTIPAGTVAKNPVSVVDLLPTFCELGGVSPSTGIKIDGASFAAQLRGQPGNPRGWVYIQLNENRFVRDERWKLTGGGELFDLKDAPYAETLVPKDSSDANASAARARLQATLSSIVAEDAKRDAAPRGKKKKA